MDSWKGGPVRLLASAILLMMFSLLAAQHIGFVERDASVFEEDVLQVTVVIGPYNSGVINITALTVGAFREKFPDLVPQFEASSIIQPNENEAEENDFSGETIVLESTTDTATVHFNIIDDQKQEPDEIFLLVLESKEVPLELINSISVGKILASDPETVSIQMKNTSLHLREEAGNVNLTIVRNGATEIEQEVSFAVLECDQELALSTEGEDLIITPKTLKLLPTDEETSEESFLMEILNDDVLEPDECISIALVAPNIIGHEQTDVIIIADDDAVRVGFNQSSYEVEEGQFINVCVAVLEPQGETEPEILIELNIDFLSNPASDGKYGIQYPSQNFPGKFFFYLGFQTGCIQVTAFDDNMLDVSRVFGIKISTAVDLPRVSVGPEVVTVTITDNDGTPNRPKDTKAELSRNGKALLITWEIDEENGLRPVDSYNGTLQEKVDTVLRQTDSKITFESENKEATVQDIDVQKQYEIQVCAGNKFGVNCSEPFNFPPPTPSPPTRGPVDTNEDGLSSGVIAAIVIVLVLLFLCCLLLLLLFCFLYQRREKVPL